MIQVNSQSDIDAEIAAMKDAVGAKNNSQLADFIGVSRNAVSLWRKRNSIPESARRKVASLSRYTPAVKSMDERRIELGRGALYAGLCLAILLAPSRDSVKTERVSALTYVGTLNWYASHFKEIELACAEEVAARIEAGLENNVHEALANLSNEDFQTLYNRVMDRAQAWRSGTASAG